MLFFHQKRSFSKLVQKNLKDLRTKTVKISKNREQKLSKICKNLKNRLVRILHRSLQEDTECIEILTLTAKTKVTYLESQHLL